MQEVITYATFGDDRLRGLGVAMGRISFFHIDLRRRPYNTLALPCEYVVQVNIKSYCQNDEYQECVGVSTISCSHT